MDQLINLLQIQLGENTVMDLAIALLWVFVLLIVFKLFKTVVVIRLERLAKKTKTDFDNALIKTIQNIHGIFYFVLALYFPLMRLELSDVTGKWIRGIFIIIMVFEFVRFLQAMVEYGLRDMSRRKGDESATAFHGIKIIINVLLWGTGLLLILSNLGFNITSLVASLGIGGIAVALAVQNILGDIFSSFSIYFDKPFKVGDFIVVGQNMGTVKKIGLKTTRIEALGGEELVISNQELTTVRVQNFKRMSQRRIVFNLGVIYDTPLKKLKKVDDIIKKIIDRIDGLRFARCQFFEFGDFSLNFEIVYYVESDDYNLYMQKREEINFAIKEAFEKEKIEIAFPTQTLHLKKN